MDQNPATLPYIGSRISLISNADIRYEGTLYSINTFESTVALQNVRSFGTEGRRTPDVLPQAKTYQYIVFKGRDIKDLTVCEPANQQLAADPAIVNVNVPPNNANIMAPPGGGQSSSYQQRNVMGGHHDNAQGGGYNDDRYGGMMPQGRMNGGYGGGMAPNYPMGNQGGMGMPNAGGRGGYFGGGPGRNYGMSDMDMDPSMMGAGILGRGNNKFPGVMRGGRGGGIGRPTSRRIVGELPPQPNSATKKEVSKAFDFESSNAKFDKSEAAAALVKTESTTSPESGEVAATAAGTEATAAETTAPPTATATTTPTTATTQVTGRTGYDKSTSFFDTISCETLDRQSGHDTRVDREKQRQLDCETFGAAAAVPRVARYPRGFRRGGRRGGAFGGFRQGRGGYGQQMDYAGGGNRYGGGYGNAIAARY